MARYFGKVCSKHPELLGERMKCNHCCYGCIVDATKLRAKTPEGKARRAIIARENKARNPDRIRQRNVDYQLTKRCRMPGWADRRKIAEVYKEARRLGLTVDHIYPLQGELVSGLHVHENLQLLPRSTNSSKGNKYAPT